MKASYKRIKTAIGLEVKKLNPAFVVLKLGKFLIFDSFFNFSLFDYLDLEIFWNLAKF